ncbi:hypothetical protein BO70DRAFT_367680 [Aspergillus heteromorphus CBS 117.55]|uniref:Zn(2)-C6 fungal-type domain-containing protein n=1 Tax=Aspergillus heteromorphus CBS 117.55 TaxID=1448321 RepID=A0A317X7M2_9EURO|nr:uncharacterized protein BO70DRAFT_367680 [Aspergillus heteromorphus CBS 117.55]PWY92600.1 hypothetical protein BO70DRAFT_367680 [Aspergillus heteromorphus CBS 117.55]
MESAPATDRRRSCRFCRSRKLRCSGASVCSACKDRQIECLYDQGGPKGRPRVTGARSGHRPVARQTGSDPIMKQTPWTSPPSPSETGAAGQLFSPRLKSVAEALLEVSTETREKLHGHSLDGFPLTRTGSLHLGAPKLGYRDLVMVLTQDLVDATVARFSSLDCLSFFPDEAQSWKHSGASTPDGSSKAFEPAPLAGYNSYRITQLIDVWFAAHPLSIALSKTLLLRAVRGNSYDPLLLAVILGGAQLELGDVEAIAESEKLMRWASSRLQYISTASSDLSTAQALSLLAWHETCQGNDLQALAYSIYANRTVTRLTMDTLARSSRDVRQINGINLVQIELEMMHVLGWMTLALMVWYFTHLEIVDDSLPALAMMNAHPPMNKHASLILRLDRAADNLSTLPHQSAWIQEIWTISHITSAVVHLNSICPRRSNAPESPLSQQNSWQTQLHQQLRNIQLYKVDLGNLCGEARAVLARNVQIIEANMEDREAQTWILTAYRTLLIHLLFPRMDMGMGMDAIAVTVDLVQSLTDCISFFSHSFPVLANLPSSTAALTPSSTQSYVRSYMAGLEACGSAIDTLFSLSHKQWQCWEPPVLQGLARLLGLATKLDSLFADDTLLTDWRWRTVKDRFHRLSKYKQELDLQQSVPPVWDGMTVPIYANTPGELPYVTGFSTVDAAFQ